MSDEFDRLPPPAFPPGSRRGGAVAVNVDGAGRLPARGSDEHRVTPEVAAEDSHHFEGAEFPEDAFISPDEPLRPRTTVREGDGEVTGIGGADSATERAGAGAGVASKLDAEGAARALEGLGQELRRNGIADILTNPSSTTFEAVLRGYIAGYFSEL